MFDSNTQPKYLEKEEWIIRDVHCVPSLIKLFFRELPSSPLQAMTNNNNNNSEHNCVDNMTTTYSLLRSAVSSANLNSDKRDALRDFKNALDFLSTAQFWSVDFYNNDGTLYKIRTQFAAHFSPSLHK